MRGIAARWHRDRHRLPRRSGRPARLGDRQPACQGVHAPTLVLRPPAARPGHAAVTRVLEGQPLPPFDGWSGARVPNPGLPRFRSARFDAAYPMATVHLGDPTVPLRVRLEALNPMVPGDAGASGIPVAVLRWVVRNPARGAVDVTIAGSVQNVVGALRNAGDGILALNAIDLGPPCRNVNDVRSIAGSGRGRPPVTGLLLRSEGVDPAAEMWGTIALAALEPRRSATTRTAWADVSWGDTLADYWDDLAADGRLDDRDPGRVDKPIASLAVSHRLSAGEERAFTFLLAWHFPNRMTWTPESGLPWVLDEGPGTLDRPPGEENPDRVGNHYATRYADAWDVAVRTARDLPGLEDATADWVSAFCSSDLPVAVRTRLSAHSPRCARRHRSESSPATSAGGRAPETTSAAAREAAPTCGTTSRRPRTCSATSPVRCASSSSCTQPETTATRASASTCRWNTRPSGASLQPTARWAA
ncbi:MAG: GH116 family glycosyl-hydrolase [Acidimicrobiia bacterium]|nr:GH116 family glycosyl-hydrolase [Acidimicrobiia bacterium]